MACRRPRGQAAGGCSLAPHQEWSVLLRLLLHCGPRVLCTSHRASRASREHRHGVFTPLPLLLRAPGCPASHGPRGVGGPGPTCSPAAFSSSPAAQVCACALCLRLRVLCPDVFCGFGGASCPVRCRPSFTTIFPEPLLRAPGSHRPSCPVNSHCNFTEQHWRTGVPLMNFIGQSNFKAKEETKKNKFKGVNSWSEAPLEACAELFPRVVSN